MAAPSVQLFQFWHSSHPPDEVATLMRSWEEDAHFSYHRFDAAGAEHYIGECLGSRAADAFRACAVPAMQADFFRYCALWNEGGIYIDADSVNTGKLPEFIAPSGRGVLVLRQKRVINGFLFCRAAHDPLFLRVIGQTIENIEKRISNNVWLVTGPGIMTSLYNNADDASLFDGFTMTQIQEIRSIVTFRNDLAYKATDLDWRHYLLPDAPSIFRAPAGAAPPVT